MTAQEIFDKVAAHLMSQGKRAYDGDWAYDGGSCVYLNPADGTKCAIGCLIPDGHPAGSFRGGVVKLLGTYPELRAHIVPTDLVTSDNFLTVLQMIHDRDVHQDYRMAVWKEALLDFAKDWGLAIPECLR